MTAAIYARHRRLADIDGLLLRPPPRRFARDDDCARSHTRTPAKMARKSPPGPRVSNKIAANLSRARLQTASFTPPAMTKFP